MTDSQDSSIQSISPRRGQLARLCLVLGVCAASVGVGVLLGWPQSPEVIEQNKNREKFVGADLDDSGGLSAAELREHVVSVFGVDDDFDDLWLQLDADQNGSISLDEFAPRQAIMLELIVDGNAGPEEFVERYNRSFNERAPLVGDTIAGLELLDESGQTFDFDSLYGNGKFTVVTFGCLT